MVRPSFNPLSVMNGFYQLFEYLSSPAFLKLHVIATLDPKTKKAQLRFFLQPKLRLHFSRLYGNRKTSLYDLTPLTNLKYSNKRKIQCQDFSCQSTKAGPVCALHLCAVLGQAAGNLNLFVSGKDDPKFLYSQAGKIGAEVSKNINRISNFFLQVQVLHLSISCQTSNQHLLAIL